MNEVGLLVAFTTGLLTFFAPCTFVTLPAFLTYIASQMVNPENSEALDPSKKKFIVFKGALAYVIGFLVVFTLLGITATFLGNTLLSNKVLLVRIGGGIMMLGGLFMLFGDKISQLQFMFQERKFNLKSENRVIQGALFPFLIGVTAALAWTPCIGPVLGAILFLAGASSDNPIQGGILLFVHGLGITIPFLILALMFDRASGFVHRFTKYSQILYRTSAVILIFLGLALLTGTFNYIEQEVYKIFGRFGYVPR